MKKVLSRVLAMAIAIVLFAAPVTTQAATIDYVVVNGNSKEFHFLPSDLLIVNSDVTMPLSNDINNGNFYASSNGTLHIYVHEIMPSTFTIFLYDVDQQKILNDFNFEFDNTDYVNLFYPIFHSGNYKILIKSLYSTASIVDWYSVEFY